MDTNYQTSITSNKTHLTFAIADLIIYEGFYFNFYQKAIFKKVPELVRDVSKAYITPDIKITSKITS